MNYLKIVAKGWQGYTGLLGMVHFKDGVSVDPQPRPMVDRLSAVVQMVEILENGKEVAAGVARRLVEDSGERAPVTEKLLVQTEAERAAEMKQVALKGETPPVQRFYTQAELEAIVDQGGIKGLRTVAEPWGVKGRSIPELLLEVLQAQAKYLEDRAVRERAATQITADQIQTAEIVLASIADVTAAKIIGGTVPAEAITINGDVTVTPTPAAEPVAAVDLTPPAGE